MKKFVKVAVDFECDGSMVPRRIIWEDGRIYTIDEVRDVRYFKLKNSDRLGVKYVCKILGKQRDLFFDDVRWYVECLTEAVSISATPPAIKKTADRR